MRSRKIALSQRTPPLHHHHHPSLPPKKTRWRSKTPLLKRPHRTVSRECRRSSVRSIWIPIVFWTSFSKCMNKISHRRFISFSFFFFLYLFSYLQFFSSSLSVESFHVLHSFSLVFFSFTSHSHTAFLSSLRLSFRIISLTSPSLHCLLTSQHFGLLLRQFPKAFVTPIVGFKFESYARNKEIVPSSLYDLSALLVRDGIITVDELYPYLSHSDDDGRDSWTKLKEASLVPFPLPLSIIIVPPTSSSPLHPSPSFYPTPLASHLNCQEEGKMMGVYSLTGKSQQQQRTEKDETARKRRILEYEARMKNQKYLSLSLFVFILSMALFSSPLLPHCRFIPPSILYLFSFLSPSLPPSPSSPSHQFLIHQQIRSPYRPPLSRRDMERGTTSSL